MVSRRIEELGESQTLFFAQQARQLKEAGVDVVSLTAGEPDFPTPRHIKDAAIEALRTDFTHYTANQGMPELLDAIGEKFSLDNGLRFTREQILVSCGAKQSIFNALCAILNPGDEVIIPAPYWVSYPSIVRLAGGIPVVVPLAEAGGYRIDPLLLRKAVTPRTRVLLLNSPGNPTGVALTREEAAGIARVVQESGILAVSDEIYEKVIFDRRIHVSIGSLEGMEDRVVTVNGVSKAYAMTGWRIGYMGGPMDIVHAAAKVQGQTTNNANSIAQKATIAALRGPQEPIQEMTAEFERRRDVVVHRLSGIPSITFTPPEGAMYVLINASGVMGRTGPEGPIANPAALAHYLLHRHHVALIPGDAFGAPTSLRLSFACSRADLEKGLARLARGLEELKN
jgi:aspartate aminotransferase